MAWVSAQSGAEIGSPLRCELARGSEMVRDQHDPFGGGRRRCTHGGELIEGKRTGHVVQQQDVRRNGRYCAGADGLLARMLRDNPFRDGLRPHYDLLTATSKRTTDLSGQLVKSTSACPALSARAGEIATPPRRLLVIQADKSTLSTANAKFRSLVRPYTVQLVQPGGRASCSPTRTSRETRRAFLDEVTDRGDWPVPMYFMGMTGLRIRRYRDGLAPYNVRRN